MADLTKSFTSAPQERPGLFGRDYFDDPTKSAGKLMAFAPMVGVSIVTSTLNSLNSLGGLLTGQDYLNEDWVIDSQNLWDSVSPTLGDYYGEMSGTVEGWGFVGSLFVGGLGAVKAIGAAGKAAKGLAGLKNVDRFAETFTSLGIKANLFQRATIVNSVNAAIKGELSFSQALPKAEMIAKSLVTGTGEALAFEIGAFATTNQNITYNPEQLDAMSAFQQNAWMHALGVGIGVPLNAFTHFRGALGAGKKLLGKAQEATQSMLAATTTHIQPGLEESTKLFKILDDAAKLPEAADAARAAMPKGLTTEGVDAFQARYANELNFRAIESAKKLVRSGDEAVKVQTAEAIVNLAKKVRQNPSQLESIINNESSVASMLAGVLHYRPLEVTENIMLPSAQAMQIDNLGIRYYADVAAQKMSQMGQFQLTEQGFVKANYRSGVVGIYRDFNALSGVEQADAFEVVLNKLTANTVFHLDDMLIQGATPDRAVKSIVGGARRVVEAFDPQYQVFSQMKKQFKFFSKKNMKAIDRGDEELTRQGLDILRQTMDDAARAGVTPIVKAFNKAMGKEGNMERLLSLEGAGAWREFEKYMDAEVKRLYDPREIIGRSIQILEHDADAVKGVSQRLYNAFTSNKLMAESYSRTTKAVRSLETGELILGAVHSVIADHGAVSAFGNTIRAGEVSFAITQSPKTFEELAQLSSLEASAHWAKAQLNPVKIVDAMKIEAEDIITASSIHNQLLGKPLGEQYEMLSKISWGGKYFTSVDEFEKALVETKGKAMEFLSEVPKTSAERELWGIDRIQRMVGAGDNFIQDATQVNPMNWTKPKHIVERRLRGGFEEGTQAEAMTRIQEMTMQAQERIAAAHALLPEEMQNVLDVLPSMELMESISYQVHSDGVAGFLKFSQPDDLVQAFTLQTGETISNYQRKLAAEMAPVHQANFAAVRKADKVADVFGIIHAVMQSKASGAGLRGDAVLITKEMLEANPMLKGALESAGISTAGGEATVHVFGQTSRIVQQLAENPAGLVMDALRNESITQGVVKMDETVYGFLNQFQKNFNRRIVAENANRVAKNMREWNTNKDWYFPPHLAEHAPHTAMVMLGGMEGKTMQMIFGATAEELQKNAAHVVATMKRQGLEGSEIFYRNDAKEWAQLLNRTGWNHVMDMGDRIANVSMQSKGVYQGMQPRFTLSYLDDLMKWDMDQNVNVLRSAITTKYSTTFHTLDYLASVHNKLRSSVAGSEAVEISKLALSPFEKMRNQALNLPSDVAGWWMDAQKAGESFLGTGYHLLRNAITDAQLLWKRAGNDEKALAESFKATDAGVTLNQANDVIRRYGLPLPYDGIEQLIANSTDLPQNIAGNAIRRLNQVAVLGQLTLDMAHKVVSVISTPIRTMPLMRDLAQQLAKGEEIPQSMQHLVVDGKLPSTMKVMLDAVAETFTPGRKALRQDLIDRGILKDLDAELQQLNGNMLDVPRTGTLAAIGRKLDAFDAFAKKWSQTNVIESWTRELTAVSAYKIAQAAHKAGLISADEVWLHVSKSVNSIHGSMLAAARPGVFHGPVGAGATLFQTYQLTMLQQIVKHLDEGDRRAVAQMTGLQGTAFGLQGMPGFDWLNDQYAAESQYKQDIYGKMYKQLGQTDGDLLLYGLGSAPINLALYNRGDVSPRFATIIPTDIADFPSINMAKQMVGAVWSMARKSTQQGFNGGVLLEGVVESNFNRPLKLLAGTVMGTEVSKSGKGVMPVQQDFLSWTTFAHALGARTMNEAVARDMMYRTDSYKIKQREKLNSLAGDFRTTIRNGDVDSSNIQDIAQRYAEIGGDLTQFNSWLMRQYQNASPASMVGLANSTQSRRYQNVIEMMGGRTEGEFEKNLRAAAYDYQQRAFEGQQMAYNVME